MSEDDLLDAVLKAARLYGWLAAHFRPALTSRGWRTAVSGDGAGFPDLVLVRGDTVLAVELKSETGKLAPEQERWLRALANAGIPSEVWRPEDWKSGKIERMLAGRVYAAQQTTRSG
jgi:hypothetical protein